MVATSGLATAQVHVDASSTHPNPDGKSWDTAWPTVREGLADTNLLTEKEMWVAKGVYSASPAGSLDPPADTYTLLSDVDYYGGFDGDELILDDRPSPAVGTILSGDLDSSGDANLGDTQHIVTIPAGASEIRLDGFTIRHGYADLLASNGPSGAGILIDGTPTDPVTEILFDEVRVKKCFAAIDGGGINATYVADFGMKFCVLARNRANEGQGGGLRLNRYSKSESGINIFSTQFRGNRGVDGGALALRRSDASAQVYSCEFKNNNANKGGGIFIDNSDGSNAYPALAAIGNCTIVDNEASKYDPPGPALPITGEGGGLYLANTDSFGVKCFNSIVWSNTKVNDGILDVSSIEGPGASGSTALVVSYSDVEMSLLGGDPPWAGTSNINDDPEFVAPSTGDYSLSSTSPCLDKGSDALIPDDVLDLDEDGVKDGPSGEPTPYDIVFGNARVVGAANDMGAYERQ